VKISDKIILSSIAAGICFYVIDAIINSYIFSDEVSFLNSLYVDVKPHELYFRLFFIISIVIFGIIISRIVSRQKELEEQLFQAKNDWEETFNSITDMITIHDKDFNIIRANKEAEKILGISFMKNSDYAKCYTCYHGTASAPEECPSCESFRTGYPAVFERYEPFLKKFIEIRTMPRIDYKGKVTGLIHIVRDTSDKKELEKSLIESEERFRTLFNQASDCILLLDPRDDNGTMIADVNDAACTMHGYTREQLIGKPITFLDAPEFWSKIPERVQALLSGQHVTFEINHIRKDRTVFPVEVSAQMIYIGGKSYILAIDRDISERKQIEQELIRHREQLMELVEERTVELREANERLTKEIEDRKRAQAEAIRASHLAALGELAAGVAHEINNPINGIINYSQMLANRSAPESGEHDIASRIMREGDRIANIVHSLLSFSRDGREEKFPVHLRDIVSDSLALTEAYLRNDGIKLKVDVPPDLPLIVAHPQQIEQVVLNIISNARYSLNQKYGTAHDNKIFEILAEHIVIKGIPHVMITFHDTGTGIPAKILDKVMNPFFTTKPSNIGTGLGLSISHGIISDHGGKILIDSIEGKYTKVIIELPAGKQDASDVMNQVVEEDQS
jgi:PAS domain S-box-containing protein